MSTTYFFDVQKIDKDGNETTSTVFAIQNEATKAYIKDWYKNPRNYPLIDCDGFRMTIQDSSFKNVLVIEKMKDKKRGRVIEGSWNF